MIALRPGLAPMAAEVARRREKYYGDLGQAADSAIILRNAPPPSPHHMGLDWGGASFADSLINFTATREERGLIDEVTRGEVIEQELNAMIERRALKASGEQRYVEEIWEESCSAERKKTRQQNRWEWIRFFDRMAQSHAAMAEDYDRRASALLEREV